MRLLKICLGILLIPLMLANTARAEVEPFTTMLPMQCGDTSNLLEGIKARYGEEIVMMAGGTTKSGDELYHSLWINYSTKTWSFIAVNKDQGVTCVIASGDNLVMFFPSQI